MALNVKEYLYKKYLRMLIEKIAKMEESVMVSSIINPNPAIMHLRYLLNKLTP